MNARYWSVDRASSSTLRRKALSAGAVAFLLLWVTPAFGAIVWDINDVMVDIEIPCYTERRKINLGDLHITLSRDDPTQPSDPRKGINATFTVDAGISGPGSGGTHIWDCMKLHFLQVITADDDPAFYKGVKAGDSTFPFPVIDTPPNGWDYIYKDNDVPLDGIQADERVPGNVTGATLVDDAKDTLPWYHTLEEEAGKAGSGFAGVGSFQECVSYVLKDEPDFAENNGVTSFSTFLVAEPTSTCIYDPGCLKPTDILLLAGFNWTWASNSAGINIINVPNAAAVQKALYNTGFTIWDVKDTGTICCAVPEPASFAIAASFAASLVGYRRGRQKRREAHDAN
jgi:hypothetical protein